MCTKQFTDVIISALLTIVAKQIANHSKKC